MKAVTARIDSFGSPTATPPIAWPSKPWSSSRAADSRRRSSCVPPCTIPKRSPGPRQLSRDRAAQAVERRHASSISARSAG